MSLNKFPFISDAPEAYIPVLQIIDPETKQVLATKTGKFVSPFQRLIHCRDLNDYYNMKYIDFHQRGSKTIEIKSDHEIKSIQYLIGAVNPHTGHEIKELVSYVCLLDPNSLKRKADLKDKGMIHLNLNETPTFGVLLNYTYDILVVCPNNSAPCQCISFYLVFYFSNDYLKTFVKKEISKIDVDNYLAILDTSEGSEELQCLSSVSDEMKTYLSMRKLYNMSTYDFNLSSSYDAIKN